MIQQPHLFFIVVSVQKCAEWCLRGAALHQENGLFLGFCAAAFYIIYYNYVMRDGKTPDDYSLCVFLCGRRATRTIVMPGTSVPLGTLQMTFRTGGEEKAQSCRARQPFTLVMRKLLP